MQMNTSFLGERPAGVSGTMLKDGPFHTSSEIVRDCVFWLQLGSTKISYLVTRETINSSGNGIKACGFNFCMVCLKFRTDGRYAYWLRMRFSRFKPEQGVFSVWHADISLFTKNQLFDYIGSYRSRYHGASETKPIQFGSTVSCFRFFRGWIIIPDFGMNIELDQLTYLR